MSPREEARDDSQVALHAPLLPDDESARSSSEHHEPEAPPVSRNVTLTIWYTFFAFAGRSIWNQNVLATMIFLLRDGDPKAVGFITASMGLAQMLISFPTGYLADRFRRDTMLKISSVIGLIATEVCFYASFRPNYATLIVSLVFWGVFWGCASTTNGALFADSIQDGERTKYYSKRNIYLQLGNVMGPFIGLCMFYFLGDQWTIRDCCIVFGFGQIVSLPAVIMLCMFNDDFSVSSEDDSSQQRDLTEPLLYLEQQDNRTDAQDEAPVGSFCSCIPVERKIPTLIALADVMAGLASGMSIRYIAIFLYQKLELSPIVVQVVYIIAPLTQAVFVRIGQACAEIFGRCHTTTYFKWIGVALMLALVTCFHYGVAKWVICFLLIIRTAFMNSTKPLTKSMLMDNVPKNERAKWSALESINMFSWSGSAVLGGILVDLEGILFNFVLTACLQLVATIPLIILFPDDIEKQVPPSEPSEDNDEEGSVDA